MLPASYHGCMNHSRLISCVLLAVLACVCRAEKESVLPETSASNNPLRLQGKPLFGADPAVLTWNGRLYLIPTTDHKDWEKQIGWSCYSTSNLENWRDHGVVFSNKQSAWGTHKAWAPDVIERDGKFYLFYYFNNGGKGRGGVGVARADGPEGPYRELTKDKLVRGHDPALLVDDGRYWLYLQDTVYELGDDMVSFKSGPTKLDLDYRPQKFEAAYVFKRNETYYFTVAREFNNLIYYTGREATGPFQYRGEIMKPYGANNHHAIAPFQGRWLLFYHEWVEQDPVHQRRLRSEFLRFKEDGSIHLVEPTDTGASIGIAKARGRRLRKQCLELMYNGDGSHECYERAFGYIDEACQLVPDNPIYLATRAWALCRTDRTDKAYMLLDDVDQLLKQPAWNNAETKDAVERISREF